MHIEDEKDKLRQISSSDENAINLMTIHKSKGLEFDTIIYYRKGKNSGNNFKTFETYFNYDNNFLNVTNFLIVFSKYAKNVKKIRPPHVTKINVTARDSRRLLTMFLPWVIPGLTLTVGLLVK